ncbi:MAG TPA: hypothetical protein VJH88_02350 [Candidatus Nanoarchaeia archaeon]|nr:hypothetical protein [Candidatus Nanoarchaeia archaeon]
MAELEMHSEAKNRTEELDDKLATLKQKLAIMKWDLARDQLNPAMRSKLQKLDEECQRIEREIVQLKHTEPKQMEQPSVT